MGSHRCRARPGQCGQCSSGRPSPWPPLPPLRGHSSPWPQGHLQRPGSGPGGWPVFRQPGVPSSTGTGQARAFWSVPASSHSCLATAMPGVSDTSFQAEPSVASSWGPMWRHWGPRALGPAGTGRTWSLCGRPSPRAIGLSTLRPPRPQRASWEMAMSAHQGLFLWPRHTGLMGS